MTSVHLWLLAVAASVTALLAYSTYILKTNTPQRLRVLLAFLRALFLLALIGLLAGPQISRIIERQKLSHLAILLDDSQSMNLPVSTEKTAESRLYTARQILGESLLPVLEKQPLSVSLWRISDLEPVGNIAEMSASAPTTRLGNALQYLAKKFEQTELASVLLISDGQNTGGKSPGVAAENINCPIFTIGLGQTEATIQVAIEEVIVPEQAFQKESIPIQAIISRQGMTGNDLLEISLHMNIDGKEVHSEDITFAEDQIRYQWSTEHLFNTIGIHRIDIEIEPQLQPLDKPLEETQWKQHSDVNVLKSNYTAVILTGTPCWEAKYARRALQEDHRFNAITVWPKPQVAGVEGGLVVVSSSNQSASESSAELTAEFQSAESLDAVFKRLPEIDLFIMGNMKKTTAGNQQLTQNHIQKLKNWVDKEAGCLLLFGGDSMFGSGGKAFAPMADILPSQISKHRDYSSDPTVPSLTDFGLRSEALASLKQIDLSRLGPLATSNILGKPKIGSETLLEDEMGNPLLLWQTYGSGRVMVLATDSMWRYGLPLAETDVPRQLLGNFWRELSRFLLLGRRSSGVRLYTDGRQYYRDEQIRIWAHINTNLQIESPATRIPLQLEYNDTNEEIFLSQNPQIPILYEGSVRPQHIGQYALRLQFAQFKDERHITVSAPQLEYQRLNQDVALLQEIAERSGGSYLTTKEALDNKAKDLLQFETETESMKRSVFLGSMPWVLPLLLAMITVEWIIRKRNSLP